mgnify:CR=1 FL=1
MEGEGEENGEGQGALEEEGTEEAAGDAFG